MAIYIPDIRDYSPFYIQRSSDASAVNVQTAYGITIKDSGYPMNRKAKQPYNNDWKDRDGDDEWNEVISYEAFTYTFECVIFTKNANAASAREELKTAVRTFQSAIANGEWKFYSSWHRFGFQKVRVDDFQDPGSSGFSEMDGLCRLIFRCTVKVNVPTTDMTLTNNQIVTA